MNILEAMTDLKLFGSWFKKRLLRGDTWGTWRIFLAALFGLGLDADQRAPYKRFTGRDDVPTAQASEAWLICGRRSGKSLIAAFIAVFLACFRDYGDVLAPGETGTVMLIASDKRQARVVLGYVDGFFNSISMLARLVESRTKESITLTNRVRIEVHTASFRAVRGYTVVAAILDEIAFFATGDSADPDFEIVNALRPAMATVPNSLLLGISSPYARRGVLWEAYRAHFAQPHASALVWRAATREMNATVSPVVVQQAYARDAAAAAAEYGAEFRSDVEGFVTLEVVEAATRQRHEVPPITGVSYEAFCDPSGGTSDSFTLAIAHYEKSLAVLDLLREIAAPFSPEKVVAELCADLKRYHIGQVTGDRYAGEWPREQFAKRGVVYKTSELTRSETYLELLPALTSSQCELLDHAKLKAQLVSLERRTARGGKDSVDHPPGGHDDVANAAAGALVVVLRASGGVLGLVEYEKGLATGTYMETRSEPAILMALPAPPCPTCTAKCVTMLPGNAEYRCGQCGHQWWKDHPPEVVRPNRANLHSFTGASTDRRGGRLLEALARMRPS